MLETLRRDRVLAVALAVATVAALVPIWWPRFLPLGDLPSQLDSVAVWHRLSDPAWGYGAFYQAARAPVPGSGYAYLVHLLAYPLPIEIANKLWLTLYTLAVPASLGAVALRFGRSPWLALLGCPLVFSGALASGPLSFSAGLPCALFALAALDRMLERPSARRAAAVVALALGAYFLHPAAWLLFHCLALVLVVAEVARRRAALLAVGVLAALALTLALQLRWAQAAAAPFAAAVPPRFEPAAEAAGNLHHRVLYAIPGSIDEACLLLLCASWLLLCASARRDGAEPYRPRLRDFVPEIGFALCVTAYLFSPVSAGGPFSIFSGGARFVAPAALCGALAPRGPIAGWRRLFLAPALAACVVFPLTLASRFAQLDAGAAGMARLLARAPRGAATLTLLVDPQTDPAVDPEIAPYAEMHAWAHLLGGGDDPYLRTSGFPVRPRPGLGLPAPIAGRPRDFAGAQMAFRWDFLLTRNEARDGELLGAAAPRARLVGRDGAWRLYATKGIR